MSFNLSGGSCPVLRKWTSLLIFVAFGFRLIPRFVVFRLPHLARLGIIIVHATGFKGVRRVPVFMGYQGYASHQFPLQDYSWPCLDKGSTVTLDKRVELRGRFISYYAFCNPTIMTVKFMLTLDDQHDALITKLGKSRGVSKQGFIRAVVIPEWMRSHGIENKVEKIAIDTMRAKIALRKKREGEQQ